ncbi:hypothetical protein [Micromonospora tarensis]|uniref:Uncharacterized protein n=1 Tax=Micromonospora tarensis TaxID=2806100 RepID=A0ABS1Y9Q2_9ACTN|nr:hypothetical protein [Micromonospora tarensis]MBM0274130.1 hypothetical protein [Micromonospora tarensis]
MKALEAEVAELREQLATETERANELEAENTRVGGVVTQLEAERQRLLNQGETRPKTSTSSTTEPAYVTALVDALADGKPLNFGGATVPENVQRRLRAAGRLTNRPVEPSFGLSEGQRQELLATGKTTSPFTGTPQLGTGKPGEKPRAVSAEEHAKTPAKQQAPARDKQ